MQNAQQSDGTCSTNLLSGNRLVFQVSNQSPKDNKSYELKCIWMRQFLSQKGAIIHAKCLQELSKLSLIVSCYNVYVFQTVKQSTIDNQSYKQYSNATGREGPRRDVTTKVNPV